MVISGYDPNRQPSSGYVRAEPRKGEGPAYQIISEASVGISEEGRHRWTSGLLLSVLDKREHSQGKIKCCFLLEHTGL